VRTVGRIESVILCLLMAASAHSTTWRVERDGSGDFVVIQDAVEAAADGDTIMIGPGRYDDFIEVQAPGWTDVAVVWVTKDLTFIGAGVDETVVGPAEYYDPPGSSPKVFCGFYDGHCVIRDLKIENTYEGIYWDHGRLEVYNSSFSSCYGEIVVFNVDGVVVDGSSFDVVAGTGRGIVSFSGSRDLEISNCYFTGNGHGMSLNGTENAVVSNCVFENERSAVSYDMGSTGAVTGCDMSFDDSGGVNVGLGSSVHLSENNIYGSNLALRASESSHVTGVNNIFAGGNEYYATIMITSSATVELHDCHILKDCEYAVKLEYFYYDDIEQDLTGNYWGTTDPDTVAEWIWDGNDDSSIHSIVEYIPMADGPVEAEDKSWTELKQMYR